ncbi:MAG: hypothetical protein H6747_03195 [Deltaproteobacteria bacterium]|nr:hypothetical protein [Deltaproteobacteria bacterium]
MNTTGARCGWRAAPPTGLALLAAGLVVLLGPATADADGLDFRGGGARQLAGAGLPLFDDDPFAQAVDVALPGAATTTVAVAWIGGASGGGITLGARPAGADVPEAVLGASPAGGWPDPANKPVPTSMLPPTRSAGAPSVADQLGIGATWRLSPHLALGALAVLPAGAMVQGALSYTDERGAVLGWGPRWVRFEANDAAPALAMTLAASPWDGLAFGIGAWVSQVTVADADTFVSTLGGDGRVPIALQTRVETSLALRLGVRLGGAHRRWLVGLSVQQERGLVVVSRSRVTIRGIGDAGPELEQSDSGTIGWVPTRADLFARWRGDGWRFAAGLTWRDGDGTMGAADGGAFEPRAAASFALAEGWDGIVGAAYSQAWAPAQTGRSNWIDNDTLAGSIGASWRSVRSFGVLRVSAGLRLDWLLPRTHDKDPASIPDEVPALVDPGTGAAIAGTDGLQTNNPGYPGYRSDGWIVGTSLTVSLQR